MKARIGDLAINWDKLWEDFESWLEVQEREKRCKTCDHLSCRTPEWEEQQDKIRQLVNAQVREILKPLLYDSEKQN